MLAWIFHSAGLQPSFLIGGIAENFGSSFQLRRRQTFHPRRRRVRYCFLRQRPEVPALLSRLSHPDLGRVRSRRYLQRPRCRGDRIQASGESDSAPRTNRSLRRFRQRIHREPASNVALAKAFCPVERYGAGPRANWKVANLHLEPARTTWSVLRDGKPGPILNFALGRGIQRLERHRGRRNGGGMRYFHGMRLPLR